MVRRVRVCRSPNASPPGKKKRASPKPKAEAEAKFQRDVQQARQLLHGLSVSPEAGPCTHDYDAQLNQFMPYGDEEPSEDEEEGGNDDDGVGSGWVNMKDFDEDGSIRRFVAKQREYHYAQQRDKLRMQWAEIENQLTAAYLECQATTTNWTTQFSYLDDVSKDCQCEVFHHHNMDLVDILGRKSQSVKFCRCLPEPIQLVFQGFLPASPSQPRTGFSIRLLQLHHHLWLTSVCSVSGFIEGLMNFLDTRSAKPLKARGGRGTRRNLTQPFSNASHLFSRVKVLSNQLLQEGLQMKPADVWALKDGAEDVQTNQLALSIHVLKLTRPPTTPEASPHGINATIPGSSRRHVATMFPWRWQTSIKVARKANPYQPGTNYNSAYFKTQWEAERAANRTTAKDIKVRQQIELGKLLCLEAKMYETWANDTDNEEHTFKRLDDFQTIAKDIEAQRKKVGLPESLSRLPPTAIDLFLKVWYAKTEVRTRFLALRAEQRPLDPENKVGGGSKLGQHEKERIMTAISKRSKTMKKALATYNKVAQQFQADFPDHRCSPVIEYLDLLQLESDDPFWNDGVFTHLNEPWAVDHKTQMGMRALARVQRGQEELRRVGWEVRRAMRWATEVHQQLWTILDALNHPDVDFHIFIEAFLTNAVLSSSSLRAKIVLVRGLLHTEFIRVFTLQVRWDRKLMEVLMKTPHQVGDDELMTIWKSQLYKMAQLQLNGFGSAISGDYEHLMPQIMDENLLDRFDGVGVNDGFNQEPGEEDALSDINEEDWQNIIDEGMMQNMLNVDGRNDVEG
ncbi:uncharacterized protein MELLADRAFT_66567 [Melampsora larici-populina 98AG31]|uniref:CxC1-like cysteine cluster associated with KDZ transposases domain-containing protein n=1 Tax=Melampsora larici-populina (strain 98AG31 / pathotype 3-4-7) TaxID=747676 RepID=F4RZR5_MELLP|nr:uncharacterized protein MELLADRAFT_66567 [Melampsora larici-populina 98AG31]EGG02049.1 hypothetical protein MELLADRAFT_66567 [Melampsora larici-populina 98AG31]